MRGIGEVAVVGLVVGILMHDRRWLRTHNTQLTGTEAVERATWPLPQAENLFAFYDDNYVDGPPPQGTDCFTLVDAVMGWPPSQSGGDYQLDGVNPRRLRSGHAYATFGETSLTHAMLQLDTPGLVLAIAGARRGRTGGNLVIHSVDHGLRTFDSSNGLVELNRPDIDPQATQA